MKIKKRMSICFGIFFVLFLMAVGNAAAVLEEGTETQITTDTSSQLNPDVYGDRIVWQDDRNGNWDIYIYDLSTSAEIQITTNESDQSSPAIYGDKIVWQDSRNGNLDIYMYDLSTSAEIQITTNESDQSSPTIYGNRIVWTDDRNGSNIYMYDISTSQETQISTSGSAFDPDVYNDKIVWQESYYTDLTTYCLIVYDLSTQEAIQIAEIVYSAEPYADSFDFAIHGDKIVYNYYAIDDYPPFIDMYDLSTKRTTRIGDGDTPDVYGDRIVWEGGVTGDAGWGYTFINNDIYMYSLSTQEAIQISTSGAVSDPAIYEDRIVWQDERNGNLDIYMFTLASDEVPEPPVADFSANITSGYAPLSVQFSDQSENATEWDWDFGDGHTSIEQNPVYTYSVAGNYTVNLTVSNEYGTDSELATITVLDDNDTDDGDGTDNETGGTETQITINTSSQRYPDIYGDKIVWQDDRNGYYDPYVYEPNWDIYLYDLFSSTETQITTNESNQSRPAIYGDRIVWTDDRNGNYDIYMYNISTSAETQITTNESNQSGPAIYGDRIVWTDDRNGNKDIYMFNISTSTETQITANESNQSDPAIYGDRIVWTDERNRDEDVYTLDIYMYDLSTSTETQIAGDGGFLEYGPAIYGDKVVYMSEGAGDLVWMYDLSTSELTFIAADAWGPVIYGDRVVMMYGMGFPDIYLYDLSDSTGTLITSNEAVHHVSPAIYGDRIVWEDDRNGNSDIYMFTLASPEVPSPYDNETDEGNETDDDTEVPDDDSDDGDDTGTDDDSGGDDCSSELTSLDNMQALKEYVECTYRCHEKTKIGLASLLDKSMRFYENGEDEKAISMLKSFIHLAESMKECKQISADEADYMVKEAKKILDQMDEGDGACKENGVPDKSSDSVAGCVTDEVCEETTPVCEETIPVCEPVCEETTPVCEETVPVCEVTKPVYEPVCEVTKSICEVIKPVSEPVCEEPKPVSKPVCEEPKPVCEEPKPACEEGQPVSEPACGEEKPACNEGQQDSEPAGGDEKPACDEGQQDSEPVSGDEKPACDEGQQDSEPVSGDEKPACNEGQQDSEPAGGDEKPACDEGQQDSEPVSGDEKPACDEGQQDSEPAGREEDQQDSEPTCEEPKQVSKPACEEPKETLEIEKSCEAEQAPAASSED